AVDEYEAAHDGFLLRLRSGPGTSRWNAPGGRAVRSVSRRRRIPQRTPLPRRTPSRLQTVSASASPASLPQRPRQSEVREDAAVAEPGDRGYPVALQREDEQRVRPRDVGIGDRQVDAERRLGVGPRWHQPHRRAAPDLAVA